MSGEHRHPGAAHLLLDLTILSDPGLLAAWIYLARSAGRQVICLSEDEQTLTWLSAGHVVECVSSDNFTELAHFHEKNQDALRELIPGNPRMDSAVASLALLNLAVDRGWARIWRGRGTMPDYFAEAYLGLSQVELHGLRNWEGPAFECLWKLAGIEGRAPRPNEHWGLLPSIKTDYDVSEKRMLKMASNAWREVRVPVPDKHFCDRLVGLETEVVGEELLWNDVSISNPDAAAVLRVRLGHSLRASLGYVLEGTAEHVTNSRAFRKVLSRVSGQVPRPLDNRHLGKEPSLARGFLSLRPGARVADVAELLDSARQLELTAQLLGLTPPTVGAELRSLGSEHSLGLLPQPLRLLADLVQLGIRRRRIR